MLWYIMHACVIMHNMIIENERGQDVDYSQYEAMSSWDIPCECGGGLKGWPVLLPPIMSFDVPQRMIIFKRISLRSGGLGMADKEHHDLCV